MLFAKSQSIFGVLSDAEKNQIIENGFISLPHILSTSQVDACVEALRGMEALDVLEKRTHNIVHLSERHAAFGAAWMNPQVLASVREILEEDFVFARDEYRGPAPGSGWQAMHIDWAEVVREPPYPMAVGIVALSDFTEESGATRVVPGSHKLGEIPKDSGKNHVFPGEERLLGSAGTAFVLNGSLWHSGTMNRSSSIRHSILLTFWRRVLPNGRVMIDQATPLPAWVSPEYAWLFRSKR